MDRRDKSKAPRDGMLWSDKWQMWLDPDTRTPERRAKDEKIAAELETPEEQKRIQEKLRKAAEEGR